MFEYHQRQQPHEPHEWAEQPASRPATRSAELFEASTDWPLSGRCRGEDAALFFGPNRFEPKRERLSREAAAKAICATCPVLAPCREQALATAEFYGVWGGLGEAERRTLLGDRGIATAV